MKEKITLPFLILLVVGCSSSNNPTTNKTNTFTVTVPNAPSSYRINSSENPALTLQRGQTYTFNISAVGHPFYLMSTQGTDTSNAYSDGVTGNGTESGTLTFVVPAGAPGTLYYDCSVHSAMTGVITVTN